MNAPRQIRAPVSQRPVEPRSSFLSRRCTCANKQGDREKCKECESQKLQGRFAGSGRSQAVPPTVHDVLRSSGQPLDRGSRSYFEARLGYDLGAVRVHNDARAQASARDVNALAYTVGPHVAFAAGQYQPASDTGRRLIAHELVHAIQQGPSIDHARKLEIEPSDSPAEAEAERIAARTAGAQEASVALSADINMARQEREVPLPTPEVANQVDDFKDTGKSKPSDRLGDSWGWGGAETKNVYHECQIAELDRKTFVAFAKALPKAARHGRDKPMDAEEALGITSYDARNAVAPKIAAQLVTEGGKTVYKLKPAHAEMMPIRSTSTKAGEYVEGFKHYVVSSGGECKSESDRLGSKFPIHWTLTADGAQKVKEAEQEHCNDIRLAFDWTLGLYASGINNLAAANRGYSSERQAIADAVKFIGVQPDQMLINFYALALKTKDRDDQEWHTANRDLPSPRHRQKPTLNNGCRQTETIDASSWPNVGGNKHPSEALLSEVGKARSGKSGGIHHLEAQIVATAGSMRAGHDFSLMRVNVEPPRSPNGAVPPKDALTSPILDFADLADRIYKAIVGLGTDEEAVYRALQVLDRDQNAIDELKRVYRRRYGLSLIEDIRDDFSGSELEYALQLLNMGKPDSAQRIESGGASTDPVAAARRIRQAVQGPGTDEEAVFAALLPFRRDTLKVQRAYQETYNEDLRDRIEDEMSGSELAYALDLFETPFERYMQEANGWLARIIPIGFGLPWTQDGWFDAHYWRREFDAPKKEWKLVLNAGKPHEAIDALFHHQSRWHVDCAVFVEVVQLYAWRQALGAKRFDARIGSRMELRAHQSTGIARHALFKRTTPTARFSVEGPGALAWADRVDDIMGLAPIGSRVRWTSTLLFNKANDLSGPEVFTIGLERWPFYQNENTIKLGPDRFGAHGIGILSTRHSRAEIEDKLASVTAEQFPNTSDAEIRAGIFISEIEIFEQLDLAGQIEPTAEDKERGPRP